MCYDEKVKILIKNVSECSKLDIKLVLELIKVYNEVSKCYLEDIIELSKKGLPNNNGKIAEYSNKKYLYQMRLKMCLMDKIKELNYGLKVELIKTIIDTLFYQEIPNTLKDKELISIETN